MQQLNSKQHHVSDDQIVDLDCEQAGEERKWGGNGLQLSRLLSKRQHWCQMELSN